MASPIRKIAEQLGLSVDEKKWFAFGRRNGYSLIIRQDNYQRQFILSLGVKPGAVEPSEAVGSFLTGLRQKNKWIPVALYEGYSLKIHIRMAATVGKMVRTVAEIADEVVGYLNSNGYVNCCQLCGEEMGVSSFAVNGTGMELCGHCETQVSNQVSHQVIEHQEKKVNYLHGAVGALLGSLVGVVLWVLIYQAGYIAAIAGLVMAVCAIKGFEKFGGKIDKLGIVLTMVITVIMLFVAHALCLSIEIYKVFGEMVEISIFDAIQAMPAFLGESDVASAFFGELVIGYLMLFAASIPTLIRIYQQKVPQAKIERLSQASDMQMH